MRKGWLLWKRQGRPMSREGWAVAEIETLTLDECLRSVGSELLRVERQAFAEWHALTGCSPAAFRRAWLRTGLPSVSFETTRITAEDLRQHMSTVVYGGGGMFFSWN
jgi:hypothetical protein